MVTHDQEEALSMADRIVVMNHGVIDQVGSPTEIYRDPSTLFVADFIGETNKIPARAQGPDRVSFVAVEMDCVNHGLTPGTAVTAVIRPEDVIPHEIGFEREGRNVLEVTVGDMEFLGSFWRARLSGPRLGTIELVADFSINAVRRLSLAEGGTITVELPAARLLVFAEGGASDGNG
jgi:iron(III) transport system ATP-binding protein